MMDVDFVVTWVNMDDPEWKKTYERHSGKIDNSRSQYSAARFRDYGLLRYWFRGVEKFAPWVRRVHFVTCGQKPEWLNADHPKLHLVSHCDYIPQDFLPTYNSTVIEFYLHRIPGIADRFVYFNDDFYLTAPTPQERFFADGVPQDIAAFRFNSGASLWARRIRNNIRLINRHFDKRAVLQRDRDKWLSPSYGGKSFLTRLLWPYGKFVTFRTPHNAQPYLKATFEEVWEAFGPELTESSSHRFRSETDLTPELFRAWQICQGNFHPYDTYSDTKMFPLVLRPQKAIRAVREQKYRLVCLNDNAHIRGYDRVISSLRDSFESILPEKSGFEK